MGYARRPSLLDRVGNILKQSGCVVVPDRGIRVGSSWLLPHSSSFRRYFDPSSGQVYDVSPHCIHIHRFPGQTMREASQSSTESWLREKEAKPQGG